MVDMEMRHNRLGLDSLYSSPGLTFTSTINTVRLDAWDASRVQMAAMMPSKDFGSLATYYLFLQELKNLAITQHQFSNPVELADDLLKAVRGQDGDAAKTVLKYSNIRTLLGFRAGNPAAPLSPASFDAQKDRQTSPD